MKKEITIVVVEDEADIREVIEHNLSREGYQVYSAADGEAGLQLTKRRLPDLVVLDIMLPKIDGLDICREIKADPETNPLGIIMLTAKGEESDIVLGLGMGADDYITKPFSPKELIARVKAVLRRGHLKKRQVQQDRIVRGKLVIDIGRHEVRIEDVLVMFTPTELRLLHFLASYPGKVFTREHLLSQIIGENTYVVDRNIDVRIRSIRIKLGEHRDLIETIRGVGYRFQDEEE